jgi:flagellar basal-body rod protein FlgB
MLDRLTASLDFQATALTLRSERSRVLASNIANADTPNYKARDFDFRAAMTQAVSALPANSRMPANSRTAGTGALAAQRTSEGHLPTGAAGGTAGAGSPTLLYRTPLQTSLDANTVDLDKERANFAENSVRYEASLRFINGQIRQLMTAINGQ